MAGKTSGDTRKSIPVILFAYLAREKLVCPSARECVRVRFLVQHQQTRLARVNLEIVEHAERSYPVLPERKKNATLVTMVLIYLSD